MAAPIVTWLQVEYDDTDSSLMTIRRVKHPMTVLEGYNAGKLGNSAAAVEFKDSYGDKPLWDVGIVEAGKASVVQNGEFLLCNNLEKDPGNGPSDPVSSMINVTLNVTDRKGESRYPEICGETEAARQATLKYRLFQKTGDSTWDWGIYDRSNSYAWAAITTEGTGASQALDESTYPVEVTYNKSQIVNNVANNNPITSSSNGGTIEGAAENWTGTDYPGDGEYFNDTAFIAKNFTTTDTRNYARIQMLLKAKPTADAGTILFIVRANYQYT